MKLRSRMLAFIGLPVLLVLLIISVVSYKYSDSLLTSESEQLMSMTAQKYGSDIESIMSKNISYIDMIALKIEKKMPSDEELLDDLTYYTQKIPDSLGF
ncbi:MAG: methyl-accepting chemotaxis protein, partial [Peptoanaerobacter stomatis]